MIAPIQNPLLTFFKRGEWSQDKIDAYEAAKLEAEIAFLNQAIKDYGTHPPDFLCSCLI